jgi:hypothetical protein
MPHDPKALGFVLKDGQMQITIMNATGEATATLPMAEFVERVKPFIDDYERQQCQ